MTKSFDLKENVPLAPLTTLRIGGNARYFVRAETEQQIVEALEFARANGHELFIMGGGSNVLIADGGFDGLVLQVALRGIRNDVETNHPVRETQPPLLFQGGERGCVTAQAGEDWDEFVAYCVEHDLAGVECLSGIPGFVGGTPVQNVGAYGQEVSETIVSVRCFDRRSGEFVTLSNADCGFTYRTSIFNSTERDRYVVVSVTFALTPGGVPKVVYKDLIEHFADSQPTLAEVREAVLAIRRAKSMVIDEGDPNSRSAGSFFKNPIVERSKLEEIRASFERMPYFEFGDKVKIPAAWLIENAGFSKGFAIGYAGISANHTLALINRGGASSAEMIALKDEIQRSVDAKFGIQLQPEPIFIGF